MARPLRIQYPGAWYHVMNRGIARQSIYQNESHRLLFLSLLQEVNFRYHVQIHAYCLMGNHYHLLLRTLHANLDQVMRHLNGVYTQQYNLSVQKDGALFRGRYKSCLIEAESYLIETSRYIHLNPVVAKIVDKPEDYPWSSYRLYIELESSPPWLIKSDTLNFFGKENQNWNYQLFVQDGMKNSENEFSKKIRKNPILGSESFVKTINENLIPKEHKIPEIPMHKLLLTLPDLSQIQKAVANFFQIDPKELLVAHSRRLSLPKYIAIYLAVKFTQEKNSMIASHFGGIAACTVSYAYRLIQKKINYNKPLALSVRIIEQELSRFET